jgi:Kef-type K+ transport system membrane component KefB
MSHLLQLLLLLAILTVASKGAGQASTRFGQPAVFGELVAGLVLGPSLLNILSWPLFSAHPEAAIGLPDLGGVIQDLAEIGVVLLMFVAGIETDLAEMRRIGRVAFWAALGGVLLPLLGGAGAARLFGYGWAEGLFMGAVLTATSVSISAQTLMEIGALRTREGSTILGAAVIDDVMGIVVLSLVVAFAGGGAGRALTLIGLRMVLFFVAAWLIGRRFFGPLAAAASRLRVSEPLMAVVVVTAFLYGWAAEALGGVASITGSYMAGVLFAQTSFRERIVKGIHPLTYSFFVPVFFVNIGLRADIKQLGTHLPLTLVVTLIAVAGKVIGCGGLARLVGFSRRESYRVGVGMISRGEVGLIVAGYGLAHRVIDGAIFSSMVIMVLVTTLITPIWLRRAFPRAPKGPGPSPVYESVAHLEEDAPD